MKTLFPFPQNVIYGRLLHLKMPHIIPDNRKTVNPTIVKPRITNALRASASPCRAGHLQSVLSARQRKNRPSRAKRSHPT
jgi:hypothetical protein